MSNPFIKFLCKVCGPSDDPCEHWLEHKTISLLKEELKFNRHAFLEIIHLIREIQAKLNQPTGMIIREIGKQENEAMSTQAGGTSNFQMAYTPMGSIPPSGTTQTWTVDTKDVTLTPSADGTTCAAAVVASPTATSYNLTCTSSLTPPGAPTPISATLNVPIVTVPPAPTGMTITQLS
jgi:hypothetical protein